jgi:predicted NBD/HSP70 family sugar kinase
MSPAEKVVAGVDLGGTAINYTFLDERGEFLIDGLCEHPARSVEGPAVCLGQIADGLEMACGKAGVDRAKLVAVGLDTPGPASAGGVLSRRGSTNFVHPQWAGYDMRTGLERKLGRPVTYLNDGNAAALWGHVALFGRGSDTSSVSAIVGTGLGGGVISGGATFPVIGSHDEVAETFLRLSNAGLAGMALMLVNYVQEMPILRDEVLPRLERLQLRQKNG